MPAVLCGDLNTPQYEARDGTIQTFAQPRSGRLRPARGERHDHDVREDGLSDHCALTATVVPAGDR